MRQLTQKSWHLAGVALALVFLASGPMVAQTLATFDLTGTPEPTLAGVYTSPYSGNINGGPTIPVICDDFVDDSYVPEEWTAYVTYLSSIISGTADTSHLNWHPPILSDSSLTETTAYEVAAVLSIDILSSTSEAQQDYSYALWGLFDPTGAFGALTSCGVNCSSDLINATSDLNAAITYVTTSSATSVANYLNNYDVTIYSYDASGPQSPPTGNCPSACPVPQEFITVNMAEPPSLAVLAVYLLLGGGGFLFLGRRSVLRADR